MGFEYGKVNREKLSSDVFEFRPKPGTSQVRVLPPHPESDLWYNKVSEHWVDSGPLPCPRQFGKECPICEEGERLFNSGTEAGVLQAKELRPKDAFYYNVVVFSTQDGKVGPKNGVLVMKTGVKVYRHLKDLDNDIVGGWGDITNLDSGFDVRITRTGEGKNDTEYLVKGVPNSPSVKDALAKHGVDLDSLKLVNLDAYIREQLLSYDEIRTKFQNKRTAPGFPSGPRTVVGTTPSVNVVPEPTVEIAPPPIVEES